MAIGDGLGRAARMGGEEPARDPRAGGLADQPGDADHRRGCIVGVRASRRALRALLSMRFLLQIGDAYLMLRACECLLRLSLVSGDRFLKQCAKTARQWRGASSPPGVLVPYGRRARGR